jgi:hypothetical protein
VLKFIKEKEKKCCSNKFLIDFDGAKLAIS